MGEAKTRAERRRQEREQQSSVVILRPDAPQEPPAHRYRLKYVNFAPEVYTLIEEERAAYNASHDIKLDFDVYLNGFMAAAIERDRHIRQQAAEAARSVKAVPSNIVDQVLAKNRAAMEAASARG